MRGSGERQFRISWITEWFLGNFRYGGIRKPAGQIPNVGGEFSCFFQETTGSGKAGIPALVFRILAPLCHPSRPNTYRLRGHFKAKNRLVSATPMCGISRKRVRFYAIYPHIIEKGRVWSRKPPSTVCKNAFSAGLNCVHAGKRIFDVFSAAAVVGPCGR